MKSGKINIVIDGQWGSSGKGKVAGYLALKYRPDIVISSFMPNAGHWFKSKELGFSIVGKALPTGTVHRQALIMLAPTSAVTLDGLFKEISEYEKFGIPVRNRLLIDWRTVIVEEKHRQREHEVLRTKDGDFIGGVARIASTMQGCGEALAEKVRRAGGVRLAGDIPELQEFVGDVPHSLRLHLSSGYTVLGETAQGFDLGLNNGHSYPYVTSRDITPQSFLNDVGQPISSLGDVYGVLRTFPIRVGNIEQGTSGPYYPDQTELTWDNVSNSAGFAVQERTTVTNRVRRVFSFSHMQLDRFVYTCEPTKLCITFADYLSNIQQGEMSDTSVSSGFMHSAHGRRILKALARVGVSDRVCLVSTGADNSEMVGINGLPEYDINEH